MFIPLLSVTISLRALLAADLTRARFEKEALVTADPIGAEGRLLEARFRRRIATADERLALVNLRRALGLTPLLQP